MFQDLLEREEPDEEEDSVDAEEGNESEDDEAYDDLQGQVADAEKKKAPKLTSAVRKRVQAELDDTEDQRYQTLLDRLDAIK